MKFTVCLLYLVTGVLLMLPSCGDKKKSIPKPPTYLRIEFPERNYDQFKDDACGYSFTKPNYFSVQLAQPNTCNRDISFGALNGTLHLSYITMDTSLAAYINYAIDKVDEHKVKATTIKDTNFITSDHAVYGTFFELQGNVASPFQFYLTDSTSKFVSGVVYFNTRPNYDSIRPVLNFVKTDLYGLIQSFDWGD